MKKKVAYIKCPRCELNYIEKKLKLCTVCKAELNLLDPSILIPEDDDEEERLCPICHETFIAADEEVCFECNKLRRKEHDDDDEWDFETEIVDEPLPDEEELDIDLSGEIDEVADDFEEEVVEVFEEDFEDDFDTEIDESDFEEEDDFDDDEDEDF